MLTCYDKIITKLGNNRHHYNAHSEIKSNAY